jgi:hypothetical protein
MARLAVLIDSLALHGERLFSNDSCCTGSCTLLLLRKEKIGRAEALIENVATESAVEHSEVGTGPRDGHTTNKC